MYYSCRAFSLVYPAVRVNMLNIIMPTLFFDLEINPVIPARFFPGDDSLRMSDLHPMGKPNVNADKEIERHYFWEQTDSIFSFCYKLFPQALLKAQ